MLWCKAVSRLEQWFAYLSIRDQTWGKKSMEMHKTTEMLTSGGSIADHRDTCHVFCKKRFGRPPFDIYVVFEYLVQFFSSIPPKTYTYSPTWHIEWEIRFLTMLAIWEPPISSHKFVIELPVVIPPLTKIPPVFSCSAANATLGICIGCIFESNL